MSVEIEKQKPSEEEFSYQLGLIMNRFLSYVRITDDIYIQK